MWKPCDPVIYPALSSTSIYRSMATKIGFGTGAPQSTCGSRYPTKHIFRVKYSTPNPVPVCAGNLNVYPMKRTTCLKYKQTKNSDENTIEISV